MGLRELDILFVLGAGKFESRERAKYAAKIAESYYFPIVAAGGIPNQWNILSQKNTESDHIRRTLIDYGIDDKRIISEDCSQGTKDNFYNSLSLVEKIKAANIGIVTGKAHAKRAEKYARNIFRGRNIETYTVPLSIARIPIEAVSLWWEFCANNRDYFLAECSSEKKR